MVSHVLYTRRSLFDDAIAYLADTPPVAVLHTLGDWNADVVTATFQSGSLVMEWAVTTNTFYEGIPSTRCVVASAALCVFRQNEKLCDFLWSGLDFNDTQAAMGVIARARGLLTREAARDPA